MDLVCLIPISAQVFDLDFQTGMNGKDICATFVGELRMFTSGLMMIASTISEEILLG